MTLRRLVVPLTMLVTVCASPEALLPQGTALTVGAVLGQVRTLITQAEDSASHLIQAGNTAAAQQQMLLAGLLRGVLEQAEAAYGRSLEKTIDGLVAAERDAFGNLQETLRSIERLKSGTAADVDALIRQTQAASNQVLSQIPLVKRHPTLAGIRTRDILAEFDENPKDIEILGAWIVDPELKRPPEVRINDVLIDSKHVSAFADRVEIHVPDEIKTHLAFDNLPCNPRRTFRVGLTVYYPRYRGIWPFRWTETEEWRQSLNALPGTVQYRIEVLANGQRIVETEVSQAFRAESPNFDWSCEQNISNNASWSLPPNVGAHFNNDVAAGWAELGGRWENQGCSLAVAGTTATGNCWVRGGNKDCVGPICNCPGGGHGRVAVWGTYTTRQVTRSDFGDESVFVTTMVSNSEVFATLPSDDATLLRQVTVRIQRANKGVTCSSLYDSVTLNLPAVEGVNATSQDGEFEVRADRVQVAVRKKPYTVR